MMSNTHVAERSSLQAVSPEQPTDAALPLIVDLDGTLVLTDTLHEAFLALLRVNPWVAFKTLFSIPKGRAKFKERVAEVTPLQLTQLPYNKDLLLFLKSQGNRRLILATGAPKKVAAAVATHLGMFECVLCSEGAINLTGPNKAAAIAGYLNGGDFHYAGNSRADLPIWARAKAALVVNASPSISREVNKLGINIDREFPRRISPWRLLFR
jgi:phosphoserine phosphatase